ncbi:MAG: nicotinamide mononucleotide transporter [Bacteroidetes bacterium]|nr:nicotinamide mononucleotide transporter [Bacteroidota bacterium]
MPYNINIFEIISVVISLLTTFLTIRQKIIRWPIDIFILLLNLYIHHQLHLYDRWIFSIVILSLDFYGWYNWRYGGPKKTVLKVKRLNLKSLPMLIFFGSIATIFLYFPLIYLNSDFPFLGAFRTIFSWIALWLASKKRQEHWFFWVILNLISINIYFEKQLYLFTIKYIIYILLNIKGYYDWNKTIK